MAKPGIHDRMARMFTRISGSPVSEVLPAPEDLQSVPCWRHGPRPEPPSRSVHELFERKVQATPQAIALVAGEDRLSYGELNGRANRLAHLLIDHGIGPDRIVPVCIDRGVDLIVALVAILKAGGAYLPLDPAWPDQRLGHLISEAGCSLLVTDRILSSSITAQLQILNLSTEAIRAGLHDQPATNPCRPSQPDQLAYLLFTSGSTGTPKGVLIEHRSILRLLQLDPNVSFGSADTFLQLAPASFDAATFEIWGALLNGATLVIAPPQPPSLAELARLIRQQGITTLWLTAGLFHAMVDEELAALAGVRRLLAGGDVLSPSRVQKLLDAFPSGHTLINGYGPTENTTFTCCHAMAAGSTLATASVPIGRPIAHTEVHVLDPAGQPCPIGVPGELHIGGAGLARGYLNRPDLTAERFIPHPFCPDPKARLYRSGDLVSWNPDGTLAFHGRLDQQIKLHGFRIEPGEIEAALTAHPAIAQAVVLLRLDRTGDPQLVTYWTAAHPSGETDANALCAAELRSFLAERVPEYMLPAAFVQLDFFPLTANGKLDRQALPAPSFAIEPQAISPPRHRLESQLHAIWSEVLGHGAFGIHDNFFSIGGHSLAAARVIARSEHQLGVGLTTFTFFQAPTIAEIAQRLESGIGADVPDGATIPSLPSRALWGPDQTGCFKASFSQQRLWFLDQLDRSVSAYNLPSLWHLQGDLDLSSLQAALDRLLERHAALRTSFTLKDGELLQSVHGPQPVELHQHAPGEQASSAEIEALLEGEIHRPFDLSRPPLIRALLIRRSPDDQLLLLTLHHIVADAWSESILDRELGGLYNAARRGLPAALPPLPLQVADFAAWQRQRLDGQRRTELLAYWLPQLQDLPLLDLPTDQPRPAAFTYKGDTVHFVLEPTLSGAFESLCRQEGATLQMGLLALVAVLLHRYSRQEDVAIGVPTWGRNHPDLEPLIGFFINTLVIRSDLSGSPSFLELLARLRTSSLEAYDHQELPFEQLVEALQPERDRSRNPLVQVMVQLLDLPPRSLDLDGLEADVLPPPQLRVRMDLELYFRRTREGLGGSLCYSTDLFTAERIERLAGHLRMALAGSVAHPERPIAELALLSDGERRQLEAWGQGPRRPLPERCVHQLFEEQAARNPDATALVFAQQKLSYAELNVRANRLADLLIEQGVAPGQIVAICLERSTEMVVALLAILKAGAAYLPLDPDWPDQRLRLLLEQAGAQLLVSRSSRGGQTFPWPGVTLDPDGLELHHRPSGNPEVALDPHHLAYVTYTSGTTATPKGVLIEHRSILRLICSTEAFTVTPDDVVLQLAPLAFDAATLEIWGSLLSGARLVIAPPGTPSLSDLAQLLAGHRITTLWLTAGLFHAMVDEQLEALSALRQVLAGGDVISPSRVQKLLDAFPPGHTLINGYGPTENTTFTCCHVMAAGERVDPRGIPIGRPIAHTMVHVLDPAGQPCPIGVPGELHIGGAGLARGYLNRPELTAQCFIADPFASDPDARLYKSGDLASWNPDGSLAFHGRLDQQIKLRGFRIEPAEIEAALKDHPAIDQVAVLLREDRPGDPWLVAYVLGDGAASADELRGFLSERLPDHMIPAAFVPLDRFPLTANGKFDRRALPAPSFAIDTQAITLPRNSKESRLHAIWSEMLGHTAFGIHDNFFSIGGHSLAAARVATRIEQQLGRGLTIARFFQAPTIAQLARALDQNDNSTLAPPEAISAAEPLTIDGLQAYPASFAQASLWVLHQLEPDLTAFHMPVLWRLRGELNLEALQQALTGLMERHPTLRTCFRLGADDPLQLVAAATGFRLEPEPLDGGDIPAAIDDIVARESRSPFDLSRDRLLRGRLLRIDSGDHLLLLNLHHLAGDGWSWGVLSRDLSELYNAALHQRRPQLPPLPVHFADFAVWQRQRLQGARLDQLLEHWRSRLHGLEPLELPSDQPRPPVPSHRGESVFFRIEPTLTDSLESICRQQGATVQMGLLALVATLLHRYSRQDDFAIGVPTWGRNHPDLEPLIGFFINTLVIRSDLSGCPSFLELLERIRSSSLAAYDHQELPFEQLVEALQPERDRSRHPLVQVRLQLIELPEAQLQMDGLACESVPISTEGAKLDLSFYFRRSENGLQGVIAYSTDLFGCERIERLVGHLLTLLQAICRDPFQTITSLPLLTQPEGQQLAAWERGPEAPLHELCAHELFEQQAQLRPDAVALICHGRGWSYGEINAHANRLARLLLERGAGPDRIVAVCLERSAEMVVALLAVLKSGGAYLPLEPALPQARLRDLLNQTCPVLVITSSRTREDFTGWPCHSLSLGGEDHKSRSPEALHHRVDPASLAYVMHTSGSTGMAKAVAIPHRAVANRCLQYSEVWNLSGEDVVLFHSRFSVDNAIREWLLPLCHGSRVVIAGDDDCRDPQRLAHLVDQWSCTHVAAVPSMLAELSTRIRPNQRPVHLLAGGESLSLHQIEDLMKNHPASLIQSYGSTETCLAATYRRITEPASAQAVLGRPIPNTDTYVLDAHLHRCPIGVPGELHIGGPGLARGYLNRPDLTGACFIVHPFAADPSERLYKTGDLASWNPDGSLVFHGRRDHQIKLRGFRIDPGEIEAALACHPGIEQACVTVREDGLGDSHLVAYWLAPSMDRGTAPGQGSTETPTHESLRAFLCAQLPDYMIPAAFVRLDALPLTPNGKLDRNALPAPSFAVEPRDLTPPRTPLERQLHGIWAEVLGHGDFGIHDNFFALGGHSLAAARLASRIEQQLGMALPIARIFHAQTIAELTTVLHDPEPSLAASGPSLVPLQPQGEATPLFVIHGGSGDVFVFLHLARALAPDRPVYGLQAVGLDGSCPRHTRVEEMAAHYAAEIRHFQPTGPYHLLGYSAGGWYAHAVAAELLRLGGEVGFVGAIDTDAGADVHRRVRIPLVGRHLIRRGRSLLRELPGPSLGEKLQWLRERGRAAKYHLLGLRRRGSALQLRHRSKSAENGELPAIAANPTRPLSSDYYLRVHALYRPPRLPIAVDVFATASTVRRKRWIWQFYARKGVLVHPFLKKHSDFYNADLMPALASLLRERLEAVEAGLCSGNGPALIPAGAQQPGRRAHRGGCPQRLTGEAGQKPGKA